MKEEDIDRLFRDAFHEAEETPNQSVWQQIEKKLDKPHKAKVFLLSRKQLWMKYTAAVVVLACLTFGLRKLTRDTNPEFTEEDKIATSQQQENNFNIDITKRSSGVTQEQSNEDEYLKTSRDQTTRIPLISSAIRQDHKESRSEPESHKTVHVKLKINHLEESKPSLLSLGKLSHVNISNLPVHQVTEMEDIKPLIELDEETESMYAQASHETTNKNIVTSILNSISETIEVSTTKDIRFRADDEGSLRIDILNSLAKNRNKKK